MKSYRKWSAAAFALGILLLRNDTDGVAVAAAVANHAGPAVAESLRRLAEGNQRFVSGTSKHPDQTAARRNELATDQHPFAVILGCSDSRVPVELIFDEGLGGLFVVRVAGNILAADDLGSCEYATRHLKVPLIVVLGHEGCGAVTSALLPDSVRAQEPQGIQTLLGYIVPALKDIAPSLSQAERVHAGVEANVRQSVQQLQSTPEFAHPHEGLQPTIVGAVYDLKTGKVRMLK
jgi:carbonic anhydrase